MSCRTKAIRSAGANASSTTSSARPTESAISASCAVASSGPVVGSGTCGPSASSRRDLRPRSMSRHTRATTVVSHPQRFLTSLVSARREP